MFTDGSHSDDYGNIEYPVYYNIMYDVGKYYRIKFRIDEVKLPRDPGLWDECNECPAYIKYNVICKIVKKYGF